MGHYAVREMDCVLFIAENNEDYSLAHYLKSRRGLVATVENILKETSLETILRRVMS